MTIRFHRLEDQEEDRDGMSRRMFLMTTTMAGITTSALLGGASFAASGVLNDAQSANLLQMVQDIYPHPDLLQLEHYQAIAATVMKNADDTPEAAKALAEGIERINAQAESLFGMSYIDLKDADAREAVLRHFQNDGFFQSVRWTAYFGIYDNKDIWPIFGYQGSSVEHGGYIDRGFSDITFVPEGPTLEERIADVQG